MNLIAVMLGRKQYAAARVVTKVEKPVTTSKRESCGLIIGDEPPNQLQFGAAKRKIIQHIQASDSTINLIIEAPFISLF